MGLLYLQHHLAHQLAQHEAHLSAHWLAHRLAQHEAHYWPGSMIDASVLVGVGKSGDTNARHLLESATKSLRLLLSSIQSYSLILITAVAIGAGVVVAMRWFAVRRYLSRRSPLVRLVPTPSFDPVPEEVFRFATTVLRTHRVTRLSGVRRASAVRIRLHQVDGRVVFDLEGHRRVESVLRVASFGGVERRVLRSDSSLPPSPASPVPVVLDTSGDVDSDGGE
jgi:hypothetical protein